jgi:transglutaminase-like putative cysteine protease
MTAPDHQTARTYQVRHRTEYNYEEAVTGSYGRTHLTPRNLATQSCTAADLSVSPSPDLITEHVDHFGNVSNYVEVIRPTPNS